MGPWSFSLYEASRLASVLSGSCRSTTPWLYPYCSEVVGQELFLKRLPPFAGFPRPSCGCC